MHSTWIVVADACRARFFAADRPAGPLIEMDSLSNPQARLHEGDLVTDRGGRDVSGNGGRHGLGTPNAAKTESTQRFAGEVCAVLEAGRRRHAFDRLYVLSAPAFLGMLRQHQSNGLRSLVTREVAKDVTTQTPEQIRAQLPDYL
jgi:protein required for attachment to host cells